MLMAGLSLRLKRERGKYLKPFLVFRLEAFRGFEG